VGDIASCYGSPSQNFLDHGTDDWQLLNILEFGHAVTNLTIELGLHLRLPFGIMTHGEEEGHHFLVFNLY
jgi:hypothetical protein